MVPPVAAARPTIRDVAARAGVSKSLVSLVMRGSPKVSDERRGAVLAAAQELGYRPNAVARSLVQQRTFLLGVLISDLHNPFFAEIVDGIQQAAHERGYRALFGTGDRVAAREEEAVEALLQLRTDGLILLSPKVATDAIAAAAAAAPTVLVSRADVVTLDVDTITSDNVGGGRLVVAHLAELGHQRIAHVAGPGDAAAGRRDGYRAAMAELGLARFARVVAGDFTEDGGYRGVRALLRRGLPPTAVFAANDLAAVGALNALEEAGLVVPDDVSLVGYDNTALANLRHVGLTSVDQPRLEMGRLAVETLHERIQTGRSGASHTVMTPRLISRTTTAPPPRR